MFSPFGLSLSKSSLEACFMDRPFYKLRTSGEVDFTSKKWLQPLSNRRKQLSIK
jgi:hypothetical protein